MEKTSEIISFFVYVRDLNNCVEFLTFTLVYCVESSILQCTYIEFRQQFGVYC